MKTSKLFFKTSIIAASAVLFVGKGFSQDAQITQQWANPLRVNPAIMGPSSDLKAILHYRSQWGAVDKGYQTYSFTFMYPLYLKEGKHKIDLGLNVMNDKEGAFNTLDFALAVGYNVQISNSNNIALALTGGYVQKSLDANALTFDEQYQFGSYNASNTNGETVLNEKIGYPDVGFGLMWNFSLSDNENLEAYLGVSGYHMNEPNMTLSDGTGKLPRKLLFQGGLKVKTDDKVDFTPNCLVISQNNKNELLAGLSVDYRFNETITLLVGGWYRNPDALAFMIGGEAKGFQIAYSYDIPNSNINRAISKLTTHEITLSYRMNMKKEATAASY
ncbi:MAG: hypothetical protein COA57_16115 [Flavobacteriales bacterium]|nr:MAG: hypothetical protein COA57_16115 [Flavobacteriales bacterium]